MTKEEIAAQLADGLKQAPAADLLRLTELRLRLMREGYELPRTPSIFDRFGWGGLLG